MNIFKKITPFVLLLALTGCFFASYHETAHYDLSKQKIKTPAGVKVKVLEFENNSGAARKMRLRTDKYRIIDAGYSKWIQSPGAMVARCLENSFSQPDASLPVKEVTVQGTLSVFEIDLDRKKFDIRGQFTVSSGNKKDSREFFISEPVKKEAPEEFAAAASLAVAKLGRMIKSDIEKISHNSIRK
jgi:uncharacterized lipoprotein YmbA